MDSDLEKIVSADEEARARVALEEERSKRFLAAAHEERAAAIAARQREAADALERELRAIREEGERRVEEVRARQADYRAALTNTGERRFDEAVALHLRIVCEVKA